MLYISGFLQENERILAEEEASKRLIEQMLAEDQRISDQINGTTRQETNDDEAIARTIQMSDSEVEVKTLRNNRRYLSHLSD